MAQRRGEVGYFLNPEGYDLVKSVEDSSWWKAWFHFTLDPVRPMTYVDPNGQQWRTGFHQLTDMASIPRLIQVCIPKDRFIGPYLHDYGYRFGGLYRYNGISFVFNPLTRRQLDDMLYLQCLADPMPAWRSTACTIWTGVRAGGWTGYRPARSTQPEQWEDTVRRQ
jgi:hypothetical protein